jgi:hypothetical protein
MSWVQVPSLTPCCKAGDLRFRQVTRFFSNQVTWGHRWLRTGLLLLCTGSVLALVAAPFRYYQTWRTYQALQPLWEAIHGAFPEVVPFIA